MEAPDPIVLREALRQGERILGMQDTTRESILRRAGELLRLTVASIGGLIVVVGLVSAASIKIVPFAFAGFVIGVVLQMASAGVLAALLCGGRTIGAFAYGPDMETVSVHLTEGPVDEQTFLRSLLEFQPDWIHNNNRLMVRMQRMNAVSMTALAGGTGLILVALAFIAGEPILAS